MIFGAKAAPAYTIAKDIIHLILCLQELVNNDPEVSPYLKKRHEPVLVQKFMVQPFQMLPVSYLHQFFPHDKVHSFLDFFVPVIEFPGTGGESFCLAGRSWQAY